MGFYKRDVYLKWRTQSIYLLQKVLCWQWCLWRRWWRRIPTPRDPLCSGTQTVSCHWVKCCACFDLAFLPVIRQITRTVSIKKKCCIQITIYSKDLSNKKQCNAKKNKSVSQWKFFHCELQNSFLQNQWSNICLLLCWVSTAKLSSHDVILKEEGT